VTIFRGCDVDIQKPVEVKIPEISALSITEMNTDEDLLGSDFAAIMKEDEVDSLELRKENTKLRGELAEHLSTQQNNNTIEMLKEIVTLKEKIGSDRQKSDQFLQDYEKRFTNYKRQLKEMETKLSQEKPSSLMASDMQEVNKLISETQESLIREKEARTIAEKELQQLRNSAKDYNKIKEELAKQEMYRKNLVEHFQGSINKLTEELKEETSKREQVEIKLVNSNKNGESSTKRIRELEVEVNNLKALNTSNNEEETKRLKEKQQQILQKYEKILAYTNLAECPVCSEVISRMKLVEHVNGCLK